MWRISVQWLRPVRYIVYDVTATVRLRYTHCSFAIIVLTRKHLLCKILQRVKNEMKFSIKFYDEINLILFFVANYMKKYDFQSREQSFAWKIHNFLS